MYYREDRPNEQHALVMSTEEMNLFGTLLYTLFRIMPNDRPFDRLFVFFDRI